MGHNQDGGKGEGEGVNWRIQEFCVGPKADYTDRKGIYLTSTTVIYVLQESLILFANPKFI